MLLLNPTLDQNDIQLFYKFYCTAFQFSIFQSFLLFPASKQLIMILVLLLKKSPLVEIWTSWFRTNCWTNAMSSKLTSSKFVITLSSSYRIIQLSRNTKKLLAIPIILGLTIMLISDKINPSQDYHPLHLLWRKGWPIDLWTMSTFKPVLQKD